MARVMRLLHVVGVVFAIIGIVGSIHLFNANDESDVDNAQQHRKTSNGVSLCLAHHIASKQ